jgi:hypothetical protein
MTGTSEKRFIACGTHGEVLPAFACCHLSLKSERPLGFIEPEVEPDDEPQAWCAACDAMLEREGDWNEISLAYADVRLVCEFCFAKLRDIHDRPISALYDQ